MNHVLTAEHGLRIAVILNEVGAELGVERALVQAREEAAVEEIVELANGGRFQLLPSCFHGAQN